METTATGPGRNTASTPGTARAADYAARQAKRKATLEAKKKAGGAPAGRSPTGRTPVARDAASGQMLGRDGEVLNRRRALGDGAITSEFDLDERDRDPNWQMRAVRTSVYGKPDHAAYGDALRAGYLPVKKRHVPHSFDDISDGESVIERNGLMLMQRPAAYHQEALAEERREAHSLRQTQDEMFGVRKLPRHFGQGRKSADDKFDASRQIHRGDVEIGVGNAYRPKHEHAGPGDMDD